MKIREHKRLLIYLEVFIEKLQKEDNNSIHPKIKNLLIREELIAIILWLYKDVYQKDVLEKKTSQHLLELIGNDTSILSYTISKLEENISSTITYSQEEVSQFFSKTQNEIHYLASKPVEEWDAYDRSNYHSLLTKTNSIKKVYGIFTSDVLAEDVYAVTTKTSYFFDTKEEAEKEIELITKERKFKRKELTVHSLWLIQNE